MRGSFLKYPPIAAAAPAAILPEQAASWAYPQPEMTSEEVVFSLATGLLGRFYVSGYLNRMSDEQRALVREAIGLAKDLAPEIASSYPFWPLGAPTWEGAWTALGLTVPGSRLITVWNRDPHAGDAVLPLRGLAGSDVRIHTTFPSTRPEWPAHWDSEAGTLHVHNPTAEVGARVFRVEAVDRRP